MVQTSHRASPVYRLVAAFLLIATASFAAAQSATLTGLGTNFTANALSRNGKVVVGVDKNTNVAAFWQAGTVVDLSGLSPNSQALSCNEDGSIIVGVNKGLPFVWYNEGGLENLPLPSGTTSGSATLISANGTTIVGNCENEWVTWTFEGVKAITGTVNNTKINAISDDGSTLVGDFFGTYETDFNAFPNPPSIQLPIVVHLNAYGETTVTLAPYYYNTSDPNGDVTGYEDLFCLTADGSTQFGGSFDRYTQTYTSGPKGSGSAITDAETDGFWGVVNSSTKTSDEASYLEVQACNVDGSILAGQTVKPETGTDVYGNSEALSFQLGNCQVQPLGYNEDLKQLLTGKGALTSGWTLSTATAMSGDGSVILGTGLAINANESYVATITPVLSDFIVLQPDFDGSSYESAFVYVDYPAPSGGVIVKVTSSNNSVISSPDYCLVGQGQEEGILSIYCNAVTVATTVNLTATLGSGTKTITVTVNPPATPAITGFYPSAGVIVGGNAATASVTLASAAPTGGYVVHLASNTAGVTLPATATVASGAKSVSFSLTSTPVTAVTKVVLTATFGSSTETTIVTVIPPSVSLVRVAPSPVVGGVSTKVAVYLNGKAPVGGFVVSVSSNSSSAVVPKTITVPAGATAANATLTTSKVTVATTVVVTAQTGSTTVDTEMVVDP
ncbi:MAG TPA: hypothetical protein VGL56_18960 [Fimbriimonadaceae bacterium]|jgi:hypothetical protein